jgi:hypothetical protein
VNVAVCPAGTVWLTGCDVIVGAPAATLTVSAAVPLVRDPAAFLTTTSNVDPLSVIAAAGVVYLAEVAPAMFAPFFCHW